MSIYIVVVVLQLQVISKSYGCINGKGKCGYKAANQIFYSKLSFQQ